MKKCLLVSFFLIMSFLLVSSRANAILQSTFDSDAEGWTAFDPTGDWTGSWQSTGGNPGGFFQGTEPYSKGGTGFWISPDTWDGDWSSYIGGTLSYDFILIEKDSRGFYEQDDVRIYSGSDFVSWRSRILPTIEAGVWTEISVELIASEFTGTDFGRVMSNVTALWIRGEIIFGWEAEGLDNVYVRSTDEFVDVLPGSNHEASIYAIYYAGITTGCSQNPLRFCPQDPVTRAQMAAFIIRALEGEPTTDCDPNNPPFPDVDPNLPVCKYIKRLSELEITTGYPDGTYRPYNNVTRAQMAAFIIRALEGEPPSDYCDTGSPFPDVPSNSPTCKYIKRFFELGITTGYSDGTYRPRNNVIRRQMAAFLDRAFLQVD